MGLTPEVVSWSMGFLLILTFLDLCQGHRLKVPRSSKKLYEDNEYALYTATLFQHVADNSNVKEDFRRGRWKRRVGDAVIGEGAPRSKIERYEHEEREPRGSSTRRGRGSREIHTKRGSGEVRARGEGAERFEHKEREPTIERFARGGEGAERFREEADEGWEADTWQSRNAGRSRASSPKMWEFVWARIPRQIERLEEMSCGRAFWNSEDDVATMAGLGGEVDAHPYVSFTINIS
ncbi:hypothetical protein Sjap_016607 [Stephania japonica]|uniref:V-type proton ATPase subunit C n=1 Tax=Stephania japonica TaxID=461633 RepID=A0AAP0IM74_9MAGN